MKSETKQLRTAIALFEGVKELDAIGPYDVLCSAKQLGAKLSTDLVSLESTIRTFSGIQISNLSSYSDETSWDVFIVPGGGWLSKSQTGIRQVIRQKIWPEKLRTMHTQGTVVAGVCTGVLLLGEAGLLYGRAATTHHAAWSALNSYGAKGIPKRVVDTGSVITAGGATAGIDLALWIIERFLGTRLAKKTEEYLEYRRQGHVVKIPCPSPQNIYSKNPLK